MATTSYTDAWDRWNTNYYYSTPTSNTTLWTMWNNQQTEYTTSGTISATAGDVVWYTWTRDYDDPSGNVKVTITDSSNTVVWSTWIDQFEPTSIESHKDFINDIIRVGTEKVKAWKPPTTEQLRAQKAQNEIRRIWNEILSVEAKEERQEAESVAVELLLELLSEEEVNRYKETGQLLVNGKKFDYILKRGGGVHRIEKDKVIEFAKAKKAKGKFICVHPKDSYKYPETDNVIALKMWIENNEEDFLSIGNLHSSEVTINDFDKVVGL